MAKGNESVSCEAPIDVKKIFKSTYTSTADKNSSFDDNDDEIAVEKDQPMWKNWLQVESSRERRQLYPWQPDRETRQTEEDCDDPERLVLFDDISSSLFKITDHGNKLKLVLSFLKFFGVPVPSVTSSASADVQQFLQTSVEHVSQILESSMIRSTSQFLGLCQSYHWNDDTSSVAKQQWPSDDTLAFVRNIFVQSLPVFTGKIRSFLMVTWLWYEFELTQKAPSSKASRMYKDVRKLAKSLLKQPQNRFVRSVNAQPLVQF